MIDRCARDEAADILEKYWNGEITNYTLEYAWPPSQDRAIDEVFYFVWTLYSDCKEHKVRPADKVDPKISVLVPNCIRYLRADEEFEWPAEAASPETGMPFWLASLCGLFLARITGASTPEALIWVAIVTLFAWSVLTKPADGENKAHMDEMRKHGDLEAWPFRRPI